MEGAAEEFHSFIGELIALSSFPSSLYAAVNESSTPTASPTAAPGALRFVVTGVLLVQKFRRFRRLKLGILYACYIFVMCLIRFIYLLIKSADWSKVVTMKHGASYMSFIDLLPELLFVSIFLLTTVMWGIAWAKTRQVKIFQEQLIIYIHTAIVVGLLLVSIFLSAAIRDRDIAYATVVDWEAYYIITVSGVAVLSSATLGGLLFHSFRSMNFKQFVLKGAWNLVIGSVARSKWRRYEMSTPQFGTLWFFYYFLTEHLPLGLALAQQWRSEIENANSSSDERTSPKNTNQTKQTTSKEGNSVSMKTMSSSGPFVSNVTTGLAGSGELDNDRIGFTAQVGENLRSSQSNESFNDA